MLIELSKDKKFWLVKNRKYGLAGINGYLSEYKPVLLNFIFQDNLFYDFLF